MSTQITRQDGTDVFKTFFVDGSDQEHRERGAFMQGALLAGAQRIVQHTPGASVVIKGRGFIFQDNGKWRDSTTGALVEDPYAHMNQS